VGPDDGSGAGRRRADVAHGGTCKRADLRLAIRTQRPRPSGLGRRRLLDRVRLALCLGAKRVPAGR